MKAGTTIDGWRKQPAGHWYQKDTRSRVSVEYDEGILCVIVQCGPGYTGVPVPLSVVLEMTEANQQGLEAERERLLGVLASLPHTAGCQEDDGLRALCFGCRIEEVLADTQKG